jgi:hypothetical protein
MNLGKYEIETYYVVVKGQTETRERIVYTGINEEDIFIERYYGSIREGYKGSNTLFTNVEWTDIRSHIVGESILVNDKGNPPKPQIYLSISSIESIQRDGDLRLIIVDNQIDPITLEFLTPFDSNQAYSLLNYILQKTDVDLDNISSDLTPPTIFFNEFFFAEPIKLDGSNLSGPFSTEDGSQFRVDIDWSLFQGPKPIVKSDIIVGLIYDITDNRDGSLPLTADDISIYKSVVSNSNLVETISTTGNYILKFHLHDLGQNQNSSTIVFAVV